MIPVFIGIALFGIFYYFLPTAFFTYVGYLGVLGGLSLGVFCLEQCMYDKACIGISGRGIYWFWRRNGQ